MGWARAKDGERKRCPKSMKAVLEERGVNTERNEGRRHENSIVIS